jgi:hypothetical protein
MKMLQIHWTLMERSIFEEEEKHEERARDQLKNTKKTEENVKRKFKDLNKVLGMRRVGIVGE